MNSPPIPREISNGLQIQHSYHHVAIDGVAHPGQHRGSRSILDAGRSRTMCASFTHPLNEERIRKNGDYGTLS